MAADYLATYLNDHLAGAVAALEMLEELEKQYAGTPVGRFATGLRVDVEADRGELEGLLRRLGVSESGPRKATAWLAERAARLKLRLDDPGHGPLRLLESVEAVALGIDGKRALWASLATAAERVPALRGMDYGRLTERAEEQRRLAETARLDAARAALGVPRDASGVGT
jgi:hypothetical protein